MGGLRKGLCVRPFRYWFYLFNGMYRCGTPTHGLSEFTNFGG